MEPREAVWLEMMKDYGLREIPGPVDNDTIVGWFKEIGYPKIQDDETAWCSCCLNVMAKRAGLEYSGKLTARSWMQTGKSTAVPRVGDVVVFWRGQKAGWQGHVGLFAGYSRDLKQILVFGGNQNNTLAIRPYPVTALDFGLLGFRQLNYK